MHARDLPGLDRGVDEVLGVGGANGFGAGGRVADVDRVSWGEPAPESVLSLGPFETQVPPTVEGAFVGFPLFDIDAVHLDVEVVIVSELAKDVGALEIPCEGALDDDILLEAGARFASARRTDSTCTSADNSRGASPWPSASGAMARRWS